MCIWNLKLKELKSAHTLHFEAGERQSRERERERERECMCLI